jgi:hypothetical protein
VTVQDDPAAHAPSGLTATALTPPAAAGSDLSVRGLGGAGRISPGSTPLLGGCGAGACPVEGSRLPPPAMSSTAERVPPPTAPRREAAMTTFRHAQEGAGGIPGLAGRAGRTEARERRS